MFILRDHYFLVSDNLYPLQRSVKADEKATKSWDILQRTYNRDNGTKFTAEKIRQHASNKKKKAKSKLLEFTA